MGERAGEQAGGQVGGWAGRQAWGKQVGTIILEGENLGAFGELRAENHLVKIFLEK